MLRELRESDIPKLKEIHARANYGFEFPELPSMAWYHKLLRWLLGIRTNWPELQVIEEDEQVVGFIGAERTVQVYCVLDQDWGSPHRRMKVLHEAHRPIRRRLEERGYPSAHLWVDPQFKSFGRRLLRLGWMKSLWECYFMRFRHE